MYKYEYVYLSIYIYTHLCIYIYKYKQTQFSYPSHHRNWRFKAWFFREVSFCAVGVVSAPAWSKGSNGLEKRRLEMLTFLLHRFRPGLNSMKMQQRCTVYVFIIHWFIHTCIYVFAFVFVYVYSCPIMYLCFKLLKIGTNFYIQRFIHTYTCIFTVYKRI